MRLHYYTVEVSCVRKLTAHGGREGLTPVIFNTVWDRVRATPVLPRVKSTPGVQIGTWVGPTGGLDEK